MDRKAQWMHIPRPFPPPTIAFLETPTAPLPRRVRPAQRARIRWTVVAFFALMSAAAFSLAWLVISAYG